MDVYLKYVGNGSSLPDVPARDLSRAEAERFDIGQLVSSGLYAWPQIKMQQPATENKMVRPKGQRKESD